MTTKKHTQEQYIALQNAFDYFNKALFKESLPQVMLTLNRQRNTYGYFIANTWTDGREEMAEIALNPDYMMEGEERTDKEVFATLVHEMCHLWQEYDGTAPRRCYHNKDFAYKMESVGLITSNTGKEGGKRTGQRCSHYIQKGGKFEQAFDTMPKELLLPCHTLFAMQGEKRKGIRKQTERVTYFCPICGEQVRGKKGLRLICGDCDEEMRIKLTK